MSSRRQRKAAKEEAVAAASATPAPPAVATTSGVKRKQEADTSTAPAVKTEQGSTPKLNRRAQKKAKLESASLKAEETAAAAASAAAGDQRSKSVRQRSKKKAAAREEKAEDERELESFLFGGSELAPVVDDEAELRAAEQNMQLTKKQAAKLAQRSDQDRAEAAEEDLFQIDTKGGFSMDTDEKTPTAAAASSSDADAAVPSGPAAAWVDEDDVESSQMVDLSSAARLRKLKKGQDERFISSAEYSKRLRQIYQELHPSAAGWAKLPEEASDADITKLLLQSTSTMSSAGSAGTGANGILPGGAGRGEKLPSTSIELVRMKDANLAAPNQSIVSSVKFHQGGQLMFTAGMDKMVRLFQIDGVDNAKVQGIWLEDLPVMSAEWLPSYKSGSQSSEIIASGRRKHFYSVDIQSNAVTKIPFIKGRDEKSLECMTVSPDGQYIAFLGNDGYVILVSGSTKQFIGSMKMNMSVRSISFSADSSLLFSIGGEGMVYIWDVATRKCLYKHNDEGNISGTALALDPAGRGYYAVGADSGVVNLYHTQQLSDKLSSSQPSSNSSSSSTARFASLNRPQPSPLKSFMNLTTPIDSLLFNCDAQLLLACSRRKKDALKLIHVESQTVFANWPTSSTPLHYVSAMDFSPNSGYMALGNDRGRVLLYRLSHYPRA